MITNGTTKGALIAAAVSGLFAAFTPAPSRAAESKPAMVHCQGVNACKGKSGCKGADNACKGQNACKGKGWIEMSEKDCKAKAGSGKM